MSAERTNFVTVFRTGKLFEMDWVTGELDKAGIPCQRREETIAGLRVAVPASPATGPGKWWSVLVPESHAAQARQLVEALPIQTSTTPDIWDSQPKPAGKLAWQIYAVAVLAFLAIALLMMLLKSFK